VVSCTNHIHEYITQDWTYNYATNSHVILETEQPTKSAIHVTQISSNSITTAWSLVDSHVGVAEDSQHGLLSQTRMVWSLYIAAASSIGIDDPVLIISDIDPTGSYRIDDLESGVI
jgi:hypothetical protein